jgi:hypothetical protein
VAGSEIPARAWMLWLPPLDASPRAGHGRWGFSRPTWIHSPAPPSTATPSAGFRRTPGTPPPQRKDSRDVPRTHARSSNQCCDGSRRRSSSPPQAKVIRRKDQALLKLTTGSSKHDIHKGHSLEISGIQSQNKSTSRRTE